MKELIPMHYSRKSFYGKATTERGKDGIYLYSYNTEVFFIPYDDGNNDDEVTEMRLLWRGYSATTYRHIREFIQQYATEWQKRNLSDKITKSEIESFG